MPVTASLHSSACQILPNPEKEQRGGDAENPFCVLSFVSIGFVITKNSIPSLTHLIKIYQVFTYAG